MKVDIQQIILILFLLTGSLYSKSSLLELSSIQKAKSSFFLYQNRNIYEILTPVSLIQPVSFAFDTHINFKKVFSRKKYRINK
jgi:hypothetical protein